MNVNHVGKYIYKKNLFFCAKMNFEDNTVKAQRVTMLMSDFILKINIYILWTYVTCKEKSILKISTLTLFKFSNERPVCKNPGKMKENCILFVV